MCPFCISSSFTQFSSFFRGEKWYAEWNKTPLHYFDCGRPEEEVWRREGARGREEGQGTEKGVQIDVSRENTSTDINCTSPLPQSATSATIWILREKGRDRNGRRKGTKARLSHYFDEYRICDIFLYHRPWGTKALHFPFRLWIDPATTIVIVRFSRWISETIKIYFDRVEVAIIWSFNLAKQIENY